MYTIQKYWSEQYKFDNILLYPHKYLNIFKSSGVYLIYYKRECIYIGHSNKETIGNRFIKHYAKLTGWPMTNIAKTPKVWSAFIETNAPIRMKELSIFIHACNNHDKNTSTEAALIDIHKIKYGRLPRLNSKSGKIYLTRLNNTKTEFPISSSISE